MRTGSLNIRRWLAAIVLLLLAPILLFSNLWLRQTLSSLDAIDRSLGGLEAISNLEPAMRAVALGRHANPIPPQLDPDNLLPIPQEQLAPISKAYVDLVNAKTIESGIHQARVIARGISRAVDLLSVVRPDHNEMPELVSDTLLSVILEARSVVETGERIATKEDINLWDRMAITVQGGHFKMAADHISHVSNENFPTEDTPIAQRLRDLAQHYRQANGSYQVAGSQLLKSALQATHGSDLILMPVHEEFKNLAGASLDIWRGTVDYLMHDLRSLRNAKLIEIAIAVTSGGLVIFLALGLAVFLSRQLAKKTDKEFDDIGLTDPLTDLGNRRALMKLLHEMEEAGEDASAGLLHLDLRRFRAVNTRFGEDVGDAALRMVAGLLENTCDADDVVVRAGGAEFIVFRPHLRNRSDLEALAERINHSLSRERQIGEHDIRLDSCIGLSLSKKGQRIGEQLLTDASLALRTAKQKGSFTVSLFAPHMRLTFERDNVIAKDLQKALENGAIVPWFQPQVKAGTGEIVGAEALVRWEEEDGNTRPPAYFLPAAEEAGYMDAVDAQVREKALYTASRLTAISPFPFHIGLNLSANVLSEPGCVGRLLEETEAVGLSPRQVSIEILEAVMLDTFDAQPILNNVKHLSQLGFFIELDDFGTGRASIASLRDLKIDRVKIDRSFVAGVDHNVELQTFTRALIQLAKSLNISVLAEGVETEEEMRWLTENNCDVLQGYYFARPMPKEDIFELVKQQPFETATVAAVIQTAS